MTNEHAPQAEAAPDGLLAKLQRYAHNGYHMKVGDEWGTFIPGVASGDFWHTMTLAGDLAAPQASQPAAGEPAAVVCNSDTPGHFSIIKPALPPGTKLYLATPPTPAGAVRVDDAMKLVDEFAYVAGQCGADVAIHGDSDVRKAEYNLSRASVESAIAALAQPPAPSDQEAGNE